MRSAPRVRIVQRNAASSAFFAYFDERSNDCGCASKPVTTASSAIPSTAMLWLAAGGAVCDVSRFRVAEAALCYSSLMQILHVVGRHVPRRVLVTLVHIFGSPPPER